jgi:hypothetical protein
VNVVASKKPKSIQSKKKTSAAALSGKRKRSNIKTGVLTPHLYEVALLVVCISTLDRNLNNL